MRVPALVFVIALTAGCASQPAAPTAPAPAAVAAAAKPVAPAATDATDATAKADVQPAVLSGYKPKTRNGETVYCKKVARIGSNFATETCMTAAEAEQLERQAELDRTLLRKNQTICGTAGCGAR
jgi:hypothetical protein